MITHTPTCTIDIVVLTHLCQFYDIVSRKAMSHTICISIPPTYMSIYIRFMGITKLETEHDNNCALILVEMTPQLHKTPYFSIASLSRVISQQHAYSLKIRTNNYFRFY